MPLSDVGLNILDLKPIDLVYVLLADLYLIEIHTLASIEYTYDNSGNTLSDLNKGISAIAYNHLDLPSQVDITGKGSLKYTYDAAGERFEKLVVPTGGGATTLYSYEGAFTYRNHLLQYIYHEEGRLRPLGSNAFAYDFFIKDHLGNIRAILTDEVKSISYQTVKFETATIAAEAADYDRVNYALSPRPGGFGTGGTTGTNGDQVQLLRKNTSQSVGVGKLLKVMVNDKLNATVDYYYPSAAIDNANADGNGSLLTSLGSLLANSNVLAPAIKGNGGTVTSQLNLPGGPLAAFMAPQGTGVASTVPKAYLNIIFFDEQFKYVQGSYYRQIGSTVAGGALTDKSGSRQQLIESNITVPKNGYCYIYVSNQSNNLVYFDNFQVVHNPGPLLEENHYYPFGSKMTALCSRALGGPQNALGYQSKELDDEFDVDLNNFEARYYDPQIGRFLQLDPADQFASGYVGMGNNWPSGVDPDGRWWHLLAGAVVGGVVNLASSAINGNIHNFGDGLKAFGIGAAVGALTAAGTYGGFGMAAAKSWLFSGVSPLAQIGVGITASFMPSYNIPITNNFSLSLSPAIAVGSNGVGLGVNAGMSFSTGAGSIGISLGATHYSSNSVFNKSFTETRAGWGARIGPKEANFGFGETVFGGGGISQRLGNWSIGSGDFNLMYENDYNGKPFKGLIGLGDQGDRFRTTGVRVQIGDFSAGFNLATGNPDAKDGKSRPFEMNDGHNTYVSKYGSDPDRYRFAGYYAGWGNFRIGRSSELFRRFVQNRVAHDMLTGGDSKWFRVLPTAARNYATYQTSNSYTTW